MEIKTKQIDGIMKFYKRIKDVSEHSTTINEELKQLDLKKVQTNFPKYKFWVIFGNGTFDYGEGKIIDPDISVECKTSLFNEILKQKKYALTEFTKKNIQIQGDIQYAVVYFDFLNYSLDFVKNNGGELS